MINQLIQVMNESNASRMMVTVQKTPAGEYALVVNTEFGAELPKTPAGDDMRKALAVPLVGKGDPSQLEAFWGENFQAFLQAQTEVGGVVDNMKTFVAAKSTANKGGKTDSKADKQKTSQNASSAESEPKAEEVEQNFTLDFEEPESL